MNKIFYYILNLACAQIKNTTQFVLILFILISPALLIAEERKATVAINAAIDKNVKITPLLFGSFLEFLNDFINGGNGLWAQELINRGFDIAPDKFEGLSKYWERYGQVNDSDSIQLKGGGYNLNGVFFQRIINTQSSSEQGIFQKVYVYDTVGGTFYVYLKSANVDGHVYLSIRDYATNKEYFSHEIINISNNWQKFEIETPPVANSHKVKLLLLLKGKGTLDIDEASFMPNHNIMGIKNEYFKMFEEWGPGIIRYPGGGFADTKLSHLDYSIGHIDQRKSPNMVNRDGYQRMDFGMDEFMDFCEALGAEAHIVVNLANGSASESSEWVEYSNGSKDTEYGSKRVSNGKPEPYNIRYWEIGNEQWYDPTIMSHEYLEHYDSMKIIDPDIECMVDGNIWGGKDYLNKVFDVIGNKCDYYSYHELTPLLPKDTVISEEQRYYIAMGTSKFNDNGVEALTDWLNSRGLIPEVKLALTEYLLSYGIKPGWIDTNQRNASLEAGLIMASVLNSLMRHAEQVPIFEKTFGLNHIRGGYNSKGERIIYPSPVHTVLSFLRNHSGEYLLPARVECDKYSPEYIKGMYYTQNVPYLDISVSADNEKIYISAVNIHLKDSITTTFTFPFQLTKTEAKIYTMNSEKHDDFNSPDYPDKIKIVESEIAFDSIYKFPPHSFTLIEIPVDTEPPGDIQPSDKNGIIVYPNPSSSLINIDFPGNLTGSSELIVLNYLGQEVFKKYINAMQIDYKLDVRSLSGGVYFIIFKNGDEIFESAFCVTP